MFKDHEVAVAGNRVATIDDFTRSGRQNRRPLREINLDALINLLSLGPELVKDLTFGRSRKLSFYRLGCRARGRLLGYRS